MACAVVLRPNLVLGAAVLLAGVGLAALWRLQAARLAALCVGFLPVLFPLWHNWHFGGVIVLFSDILTNANIYMVPPVTYLIKKAVNLKSGSKLPGKESAGTISQKQIRAIAEAKMKDLNAYDVEQAMSMIAGSARSMGLQVEG